MERSTGQDRCARRATDGHRRCAPGGACVRVAGALGAVLLVAGAGEPAGNRSAVKRFDFREPGNFEPMPARWVRPIAPGFADFAEGHFDMSVGHDAPPSFYLATNGSNIVCEYRGRDIPVHPQSDYRVVAWIRPHRLREARAYLMAYLLDREGRRIAGSEVRSRLVGGEDSGWQQVRVTVRGGFAHARFLGLSLYVVQRDQWDETPRPRPIFLREIEAGAWFDDIEIVEIPRLEFAASQASWIFRHDEPATFVARASYGEATETQARLVIREAAGSEVYREQVLIESQGTQGRQIEAGRLDAGWYEATLSVQTRDGKTLRTSHPFVVLPAPLHADPSLRGPVGVVLDRAQELDGRTLHETLARLGVGAIKFPLCCTSAAALETASADDERSATLRVVRRGGTRIIGVFGALRGDGAGVEGPAFNVFDLFTATQSHWQPALKYLLARHTGLVDYWQFGTDRPGTEPPEAAINERLEAVRNLLAELVVSPHLALPWSVWDEPPEGGFAADAISVSLDGMLPTARIDAYLENLPRAAGQAVWGYVPWVATEPYGKAQATAEFLKRVVAVYAACDDGVFTDAPWQVLRNGHPPGPSPGPQCLVLYAANQILAGTRPLPGLRLDDGTVVRVFDRDGMSVVVLWNDQAPPEGARVTLNLGDHARVVEVPSLATRPLPEGTPVRAGPAPVFVDGVPTWVMQIYAHTRLEPATIESRVGPQKVWLHLSNPTWATIAGAVRLEPPPGWQVEPVGLSYRLGAGQSERFPLTVRFGGTEVVGPKRFVADLSVDTDRRHRFRVPLRLEVVWEDVAASVDYVRAGEYLIVRQTIQNNSAETLDLETFAVAPGRPKQMRIAAGVAPGETVVKHYRFRAADDLAGKQILIGAKEIRGRRILNRVLTVE